MEGRNSSRTHREQLEYDLRNAEVDLEGHEETPERASPCRCRPGREPERVPPYEELLRPF